LSSERAVPRRSRATMGSGFPSAELPGLPGRVRGRHRGHLGPTARLALAHSQRVPLAQSPPHGVLGALARPRGLRTDRLRFEGFARVADVGADTLQRRPQPAGLGGGFRALECPRGPDRLAPPRVGRPHHRRPGSRIPSSRPGEAARVTGAGEASPWVVFAHPTGARESPAQPASPLELPPAAEGRRRLLVPEPGCARVQTGPRPDRCPG
jgi:hypothetical protein